MPRRGVKVTFLPLDPSQIPDLFTQGVAILLRLTSSGVIAMLAQIIKIRRQGGYCGLDIFLFLFLYYASGANLGIRAFWEKLRPCKHLIAAVVGRSSVCSPSALSRALGATTYEEVRAFSHKLLLGLCDCDALLKHPCVMSYDAHAPREDVEGVKVKTGGRVSGRREWMPWAVLLRRVFALDLLECGESGGRASSALRH